MRVALREPADPAAARAWTELEARHGDPPLACRWEWTATWLAHFGDLVRARVAVATDAGGSVAGAALVVRPAPSGPFRVRELCVGTAGPAAPDNVYVEGNALLASPGADTAFAAALASALRRERSWDVLRLDGFEPGPAVSALAGVAARTRSEAAPFADLRALAGDSGQILDGLSRGARQQIRRSIRGFGEVESEWAASPSRAGAVFDELVELHQRRWRAAGEPGAFGSPRVTAFHRDLIGRLGPERAILFRVAADGATVGCLYLLADRDRLLFYQGGLERYGDARLKPGLVAHALCMQAALERGHSVYDFLAGDSDYKRRLSTGSRDLLWTTAARRRPRPVALAAARRLRGLRAAAARRRP